MMFKQNTIPADIHTHVVSNMSIYRAKLHPAAKKQQEKVMAAEVAAEVFASIRDALGVPHAPSMSEAFAA